MSELPSGTVTFLFTDIEGSTRLWEAHPRAMQAAIARHDLLLREAIEAHGGYVFKTQGDAFCAAFQTAPEALEAALDSQRALHAADWSALGIEPIKARMAMHTGSAEIRANDYFGLPLNRVARLLSTGYGGQILLSLATQQLVRDHLPHDAGLKDLGEGGLKDLVRAEHIYQVVAPDLPQEFPPLKSLDTRYVEPETTANGTLVSIPTQNPYKGLRAFMEADAADFFGRESLTERLLGRMAEEGDFNRFLAVVGPSGSGKSSVVQAGLVPALKAGKLRGSERWPVVEILPGTHPMEELEAVLLSIAAGPNPPETLMAQMNEDERGLVRAVKRVLPRDASVELVVVIDQFEELFTLVESEVTRVQFLDSLYAAVTDMRSRLRVIITLRADFFDRPLVYPNPGELMRQRTAVVLPLLPEELEWAIVRPAQRIGVSLEAELLTAIVQDVSEQPGALPLLQYTLTEVFERRQGRTMTLDAYQQSGGVLGALARRADEIYADLTPDEQETTRQLFLRLVTLGEGVEDTRRRVRLSELTSAMGTRFEAEGSQVLERVLDAFGRYRLLTFDRDPVTHGPTVEVAHEALIRTWGKVQEWLETSRAELRVQRQLMAASTEWAQAGKDASFLASGVRLTQFEALVQGMGDPGGVVLTAEEREYLAASVEEHDRQEEAERERQARELALQKRAARGLRVLVVAMGLFLVIAIGLSILAVLQWQRAEDEFRLAETQRNVSERLRAQALTQERDPELGVLLATEAISTTLRDGRPAAPQVVSALRQSILRSPLRLTLNGHEDSVWYASYSSDGHNVLTMSDDGTVRIWDAYTGHVPFSLGDNSAGVGYATFSPDGKTVVTVSADKTAKVWSVGARQARTTLQGHTDKVRWAVFSPDGSNLVTCSNDGSAILWNTSTWEPARTRLLHDAAVYWATFSSDGRSLLTLSDDNVAKIWDVVNMRERATLRGDMSTMWEAGYSSSGRYVALADEGNGAVIWDLSVSPPVSITLSGHTDKVTSAAFSPDEHSVVTSSNDRTAKVWDVQTGRLRADLSGHDDVVIRAVYSPDGNSILTTSSDGTAKLWDARTGQERMTLRGHTAAVWYGAFSSDGRSIVTTSADKTAKIWDTEGGQERPALLGHQGAVWSASYSPDGNSVLTVGETSTAVIWVAATGQKLTTLKGHSAGIVYGAYSPDGTRIVTASKDNTAKIWDATSGQEQSTLQGHAGGIEYAEFSPDGQNVTTASDDNTAKVWDANTGQLRLTLSGHTGTVWHARYSPDGKHIVTASDDGTAGVWDASTGTLRFLLKGHSGPISTVAYSPDGLSIVTGSYDHTAKVWDANTGQLRLTLQGHTNKVQYVLYSPDGKSIVTTSHDQTARLWDASSGQLRATLRGHTDVILSAQYSPDGKTIVTASPDRTARLWDARTGLELSTLPGHTSDVIVARFSPDGRYVVTASLDGTARQYVANVTELMSLAANRVTRTLTAEERAIYLGEPLGNTSIK